MRIEIMMLLGWGSGFRSCEYGNATFDEIINTGFVTIRNSKHDGTRRVPVTDETQEAVSRLKAILHENGLAPKNGGIFEKSNGETYSTSTFRRWLKKVAAACEVKFPLMLQKLTVYAIVSQRISTVSQKMNSCLPI